MDQYGIFKGLPDRMPFQLGLCPDLSRARDLMNRMNERIPGHYFIRHMITKTVVASVHSGWSGSDDNPTASVEEVQNEPTFDIFCGSRTRTPHGTKQLKVSRTLETGWSRSRESGQAAISYSRDETTRFWAAQKPSAKPKPCRWRKESEKRS